MSRELPNTDTRPFAAITFHNGVSAVVTVNRDPPSFEVRFDPEMSQRMVDIARDFFTGILEPFIQAKTLSPSESVTAAISDWATSFKVNPDALTVSYKGKTIEMKAGKAFDLLKCLARSHPKDPDKWWTYKEILYAVWPDVSVEPTTLNSTKYQLANQLKAGFADLVQVESQRGLYRLRLN